MPPGALFEADIAKTETTNEFHFKIGLVVVGEVETVLSRRHDVIGADGAHENSENVEISIEFVQTFEGPHIYRIYSC